jgi:hypothetical protein
MSIMQHVMCISNVCPAAQHTEFGNTTDCTVLRQAGTTLTLYWLRHQQYHIM